MLMLHLWCILVTLVHPATSYRDAGQAPVTAGHWNYWESNVAQCIQGCYYILSSSIKVKLEKYFLHHACYSLIIHLHMK